MVADEVRRRNLLVMAIVFQLDKTGNPSPEITCDGCGGVIHDHTQGVAILDVPRAEPEKVLQPIFLCKGCEEHTDKTAGPRRKAPIDQFLVQMLNSVQLLPNDLEAVGRRMMQDAKY
ncbi:MAG: hypothetical protein JO025_05400 [Verrucomicrobia bacterium]|nr:hypothetical protein [Verrucomicrobiota bacterium]